MEDRSFDAVSRLAAGGASGRRALMALGTAGLLAALAGPFVAEGKNKKKGPKKKQRQACPPAPDLCAAQVQPCVDNLTGACGGDPACQDSIACCSALGTCDFSGFISCLITTTRN